MCSNRPFLFFRGDVTIEGVYLRAFLSDDLYKAVQEGALQQVVIYRQRSGFVFGRDQIGYFDGLTPQPGDISIRHTITGGERKVELWDKSVVEGETYCYWIGTGMEGDRPCGPVCLKVRSPEVWWSYQKVQETVGRLAAIGQEQFQCFSAGTTRMGREIPAIKVGSGPVSIGLVGLIHAGEAGSELIFPVLERLLINDRALLESVSVVAIPVVNVDERERMVKGYPAYLRANANEVDLNRNFPADWETRSLMYGIDSGDPDSATYRGPEPASEPETRAVMKVLGEHRPRAVFSFHCLASLCSPQLLTASAAEGDAAYLACSRAIAEAYWRGYYSGEAAKEREIYYRCSGGSLPAWLYSTFQTPAFDLEWDYDEATRACLQDQTTPEMVAEVAERHYQGVRELLLSLAPKS